MTPRRTVIVTPAVAQAASGNWHTARRWQRLLSRHGEVRIAHQWPDAQADGDTHMIALHAWRSADAVAAWALQRGPGGLAVVLTGPDLYHDIHHDPDAQRSLRLADRLVCLHPRAPAALPPAWVHKAVVVVQSTSERRTLPKTNRHVRAVMVGHLRAEKDPLLLMSAARKLLDQETLFIDHIGAALDPALAQAALQTAADCPRYRWLGPLPHEATRRRIQRAHVLVHPSRMEGGAHVVMEAVCSGTPVIASRIDGNLGLLGEGYGGYFEPGDAAGLAVLMRQACAAPDRADGLLARLRLQCDARRALFAPEAEHAALMALMASLGA